MNLSLYTIAAEYRESLTKLADLDLDEQTLADTLEGMGGEIQVKATNVAAFCRDLEATAASIKDAEAQMKARRTAIENRATRLRKYLMDCMQMAEIQKIESPYFRLCIKNNPPAVEVFDERQVPQEFMKQPEPPPPSVNKTAVAAVLKTGQDVPGCRLTQSQRLEIA
jgi:hypothetical protein